MKIDIDKFNKLKNRYLECVGKHVRLNGGYCKGRDFVVGFSYRYARENTFLVDKFDGWVLEIPSYVLENIEEPFHDYDEMIRWFEKYVKRLEKRFNGV